MYQDDYDSDYEEMMENRRRQIKLGIAIVICILAWVTGVMIRTYNDLVEKEENVSLEIGRASCRERV